ncbi:hypothetical protein GEMRC1_006618 [Eukaryota sp. GEM-RC1]
MTFVGSQTEKNLITSFVHECCAAQRYEMFAKTATKEGHAYIGKIFDETAAMERVHANQFYTKLQGGEVEVQSAFPAGIAGSKRVGNTATNLQMSIDGENHEHQVVYKEAAEVAEKEGFSDIATLFSNVAKAEEFHAKRFAYLLLNLTNKTLYHSNDVVYWICSNCGFVECSTDAPAVCPACAHPKGYFYREGVSLN